MCDVLDNSSKNYIDTIASHLRVPFLRLTTSRVSLPSRSVREPSIVASSFFEIGRVSSHSDLSTEWTPRRRSSGLRASRIFTIGLNPR